VSPTLNFNFVCSFHGHRVNRGSAPWEELSTQIPLQEANSRLQPAPYCRHQCFRNPHTVLAAKGLIMVDILQTIMVSYAKTRGTALYMVREFQTSSTLSHYHTTSHSKSVPFWQDEYVYFFCHHGMHDVGLRLNVSMHERTIPFDPNQMYLKKHGPAQGEQDSKCM